APAAPPRPVAPVAGSKTADPAKAAEPVIPVRMISSDAKVQIGEKASAKPTAQPASPQPAVASSSTAVEPPAATAADHNEFLQQCVADIAEQLAAVPAKNTLSVSQIHLGGCKLLIASWEADAFRGDSSAAQALQRAVGARTI